jgi:sRNA-binding regulator protein Hfq
MGTAAYKGPADRRLRRRKTEPEVRKKADELHKAGLPYQMAMAIAHGKMELNDALERMARKDLVNKLMERHELSRALATQIAIGHADLEQVLARRRLEAHRTTHRERTVLAEGSAVALALTGKRRVRGVVLRVEPYLAVVQSDEGEEEIHKLSIKYGYSSADWKKVRKVFKSDKALAKSPREPKPRPQDRYSCSDRRLFGYHDAGTEVVVTLLEGEVLRGIVAWFSRYEFALTVKGGVQVTVFRHALVNVTEA